MLIWGFQRQIQQLAMLTLLCAYCHTPTAHALRATITKFTLFFIPMFNTSTRHHLQCTFCGARFVVRSEHVNELLGRAHHESVQAGRYPPGQPGPGVPNPAPPNMAPPNMAPANTAQPNAPWPQQR